MATEISLANKSQLLFGGSAFLILSGALAAPWIFTGRLVEQSQTEVAKQLADAWIADRIKLGDMDQVGRGTIPVPLNDLFVDPEHPPDLRMILVNRSQIDLENEEDQFLRRAGQSFLDDPEVQEMATTTEVRNITVYRYARSIPESLMQVIHDRSITDLSPGPTKSIDQNLSDPLHAILLIDRTSDSARGQLLNFRIVILAAGLVGVLTAVLVFYLILTKLIFSPVRKIRATAEKVEAGDLSVRSELQTGDEFEELAHSFNAMLDRIEQGRKELTTVNQSIGLKLDQLAEANVTLFESNRVKSEFIASVSHELRTPLNSIIGFAELLEELARGESESDPKRMRYLENIITSGRSLLEMINELLDMAKIESGRMEVTVEPTSVDDLIEGLVKIMKPQALANEVELITNLDRHLPTIDTDPGKLQQILYNFVSNAVKFTPAGGTVTIGAERVTRQTNIAGVRCSVTDTGPGIPEDMRDLIFEKFRQMDGGHTREHRGTGLGLAICRELAHMLGAEVSFTSPPGHGATFYVDLPQTPQPPEVKPLMGE